MSTIPVVPEGRPGLWLVEDRAALKAWIAEQVWIDDCIHNLHPGPITSGWDYAVADVLTDIDAAEMVALTTGEALATNLRHSLALVLPAVDRLPERLSLYDLGDMTDHITATEEEVATP